MAAPDCPLLGLGSFGVLRFRGRLVAWAVANLGSRRLEIDALGRLQVPEFVTDNGDESRRRAGVEELEVRPRRRCRFYAIVKDQGRGKRLIEEEPRAQRVKIEPLYSSIQDGKKRFGSFGIVFMEIEPVIGYFGEMGRGRFRRPCVVMTGRE
jgi:hypothetical protein